MKNLLLLGLQLIENLDRNEQAYEIVERIGVTEVVLRRRSG